MKNTISLFAALGIAGGLLALTEAPTRIVIIGDSTVMTYDSARYYPEAGWGQMVGHFFQQGTVTIDNRAIGGRSSRSFYQEGRWAGIVPTLKAGDFVFIQFGHNDRGGNAERYADTSTFKEYLGKYVTESRAKGAIPVLVTPMNKNTWSGNTLTRGFTEGSKNCRGAMMNVAAARNAPLIDLELASKNLFQPPARSLAPLHAFEPALNKAGAATLSHPSSYPAGAPLILKANVKSGDTFQGGTTGVLAQTSAPIRAADSDRDALGRIRVPRAARHPALPVKTRRAADHCGSGRPVARESYRLKKPKIPKRFQFDSQYIESKGGPSEKRPPHPPSG